MEHEGLRKRRTKVVKEPTVSEPQPIQTDAPSNHPQPSTDQSPLAPFKLWGFSYAPTCAPQHGSEQGNIVSPESILQEDSVTSPSSTVNADGRTIVLKLLFRIGTQIFARVIAQSADDMLRGTLVEGIKAEHSLQLYEAAQTFHSSASPLVDRLNRLSGAVHTLPDSAFVGYGQSLKASLEMACSGAALISTMSNSDSVLHKLQKTQRHLSQLIKNNLLSKWTTDTSMQSLIDQAGQLLDEIAPLLRSDTSLEEVMTWAKSSAFLEDVLKEHYRSMVEVFDELGQLTSLLRTRQAAHPEASALSHAAWLFNILSESRLGPFISTHLFTALEPVISKLLSISSTVSLFLSFPARSPASFQIKWLLSQLSDAQVRTTLPWPLIALTERLTQILGGNSDLCAALGACPADGDLPAQITWLTQAFQLPQFKDLTQQQFRVRLFDTLNGWKTLAVELHQHLEAFPGFQSPLPSIDWTAKLLNSPALAEIEAIMPAALLHDLAGWLLPVRSALQLTSKQSPYPADAPWQERLVWGTQLLMQEECTELLSFFLPHSISSRLAQPMDLIRQASTFPKDDSYTEQLRWSATLLGSPSGQAALKQFAPAGFDEFFAQLSISDEMFKEAQMLRQTLASDAPWQKKAWHVYALLMPALKQVLKNNPEWVLRGVGWAAGGNKTSIGMSLTALRVYLTMPEGLDWYGQFKWIATCTFHELTHEYSFLASTLIANGAYTPTLSRYVYQVVEIYKSWSNPQRTETQLVELVKVLKDDLSLPDHLQPLLDVIPALPALLTTGKAYMALPATMPMGQQALKIVEHLSHTDSAALTRLYDAIENYAVGGISQGINQVLQALPDPLTLLPGASAAPVEQVSAQNRQPTHRPSTHSAWAEIGVGMGGLIASTIGGLWAYDNWRQPSSTAFSSVPKEDRELETFATNQPPEDIQEREHLFSNPTPHASPIKHKAKIVAAISMLGAIASSGLIAKGIYDLTTQKGLTLDDVQTDTRADLFSGDRDALLADIDVFLELLLELDIPAHAEFISPAAPTTSTQDPLPPQSLEMQPDDFFNPVLNDLSEPEKTHVIDKRSPNMQMLGALNKLNDIKNEKQQKQQREAFLKRQQESANKRAEELKRRDEDARKQKQISDSLDLSTRRNQRAQLESSRSKTTLQNVSSDLLSEMKLAQSLRRQIKELQTARRDLDVIDPIWKLLENAKTRILAIRQQIADIPDVSQTATYLSNADLYALSLLEEMRDYYSEDIVELWNEFSPFDFITYYYKGPNGERCIAEARLLDFLNGKVWNKLDQEEASEPFNFSEPRERTEVAEELRAGYTNYIPKTWAKNKYLNSIATRSGSNGVKVQLYMSDLVKIKYRKYANLHSNTKTGPTLELDVTLDTYLRGGTWETLGLPPGRYSKEGVIWPAHYPDGLGAELDMVDNRKKYLKGEWAFHNLNTRLESLRTQELRSFDETLSSFTATELERDADLVTQQSWEAMIFDNHGTPIGFTNQDVISNAINTVERRIVVYEQERKNATTSPLLHNQYQYELKKLNALLSVLHLKNERSLELNSQDENKDAQFDTQRRDFVAGFWTSPQFVDRLKAHSCLKNLSPESPLTIQIEHNNVSSLFSMSLTRILCDEHSRLAPTNSKVGVQWPEGLSNSDPLLTEMMDTSTTYERMLKRGLDAESAYNRIKITTLEEELQQGLDRISQSKASAGKPAALMKLAEKVTVRFHPAIPYKRRQKKNAILDSPRIDDSNPPVDKEFTLLDLMAKRPQMELIGMPFYNRLEVDITKKFNAAIIKELIKVDWQKKILSNLEKMKSDTQLRTDWALIFGSLISNSLTAAEVETAKTLQVNSRLTPGVYVITTKDNKIQVHSVFSETVWNFNSTAELYSALETPLKPTVTASANTSTSVAPSNSATTEQQNDQFYTWLNAHQAKEYLSENIGGNWVTSGPLSSAGAIAESVLSDLFRTMSLDTDWSLKSNSELTTHKFFKILQDVGPALGTLLMPLTGPMAFLAAVGMASVNFLELLVADTAEEFKSIAVSAAINAAFEMGPNITMTGLSKLPARQIANGIGKQLKPIKNYVRGAKKTVEKPVATSFLKPLEPFRQTPSGLVDNLTEGADQYLTQLKSQSTIADAINNPNGRCETLMDLVATRIKNDDVGMTNIRFRAVQIWNNAMEQMPSHHFAVIGRKGGQDFVFDLSAHQYANQGMPDLTGPLILKEAEWAQKFSNATTRKLIKYKDFTTSTQASREFNSLPGYSPVDFIDGGVLLSTPQWYKQVTGWKPSGISQSGSTNIPHINPVLEAAKANQLGSRGVCWDYAVGVLNDANMISRGGAQRLSRGLIDASNYRGLWGNGRIDNLIKGPRVIKTMDELYKVRQGEMLIFMEIDPNMPLKGARPIHAMTSTGDGVFTGNKSTVLDSSLGDGKVILPAEQLGTFEAGQFTRAKGLPNSPKVEILAGYPMGVESPFAPSLTQAAHSVIHKASTAGMVTENIDFVATVLETSGRLGDRQALAFRKVAKSVHAPTGNAESLSINELLNDLQPITSLSTLKHVGTGKVLVATRDNAPIKNIMVSLGNGQYACNELANLDFKLPNTNGIVTAETLHASMVDGKIGGFDLKSGSVNLTSKAMRTHTLLGDKAKLNIENSTLKLITGSPSSSLNLMDASELFQTTQVVMAHHSGLDTITQIKLQSDFAALGNPATAQTFSNLVKKTVKVPGYPASLWRRAPRVYTPDPAFTMTDTVQDAISKQQSRTLNFWNHLLIQYSNLKSSQATASFRTKRSITFAPAPRDLSDSTVGIPFSTPFEDLIKNAGDLVMASPGFDVDMFITREPSYPVDSKAALQAILNKGIPDSASLFAARMIEVLSLTKDSFALMNDFVSKEKPLT